MSKISDSEICLILRITPLMLPTTMMIWRMIMMRQTTILSQLSKIRNTVMV